MKILIAPWGNPAGWKEVTYIFGRKSIKSRTSLKILQEEIKPEKTIIIGLDTLAEKGEEYRKVKENAEEKIKGYADEFGLKNYEILIAPGIGTFPNGVFTGNALDYYYYILAKISLKLLEITDTLDVHLDLTHGINYSTILTYRAIKEILGVLSVFQKVQFKAYNADPSTPTIADKLSINVIEELSPVPPAVFAEKIHQGRPLEPVNLSSEERRVLFESELKSVREVNASEISAFIGALYNALPLALFRFYPEINKLKETIFDVLNCYEKYVEVKNRNKLEVVRKVKFGKDFKVYIFAYITASLLKKFGLISLRKKEVAFDEIESLNKDLFKFDEKFRVRIDFDIHILKNHVKGKEIRNWQVYNNVVGKKLGPPDLRNFLAHSGFERNVVELKKDGDRLLLRYSKDEIRTITDFCQKGLK